MPKQKYPKNPYAGAGSIPVIGPTISKLGKVGQILATPGTPNAAVWVYALFHALPRFIYTFVKPFPLAEEIRSFLPGTHGKRKGFVQQALERKGIGGERSGWKWVAFHITGEIYLKGQWYLMIADRTAEFLLNWTSLAYEYNASKFAGEHWEDCHSNGGFAFLTSDPQLVEGFFCTSSRFPPYQGGTITVDGQDAGSIHFAVQGEPTAYLFLPKTNYVNFELHNFTGDSSYYNSGNQSGDGHTISDGYARILDGGTGHAQTFGITIIGDGGYRITDAYFSWYGHPAGSKGLLFDP